jgi:putative transposase
MRYRKSRELEGAIKQVTVSRKGGKWYVSIQTERELIGKERVNDSMVGIDLGVVRFAAKAQVRSQLAEAIEARAAAAHTHRRKPARLSAQDHNDHQQEPRDGCDRRSCVKGMSASAAGTLEKPGTNVKAKAGLNKAISGRGGRQLL